MKLLTDAAFLKYFNRHFAELRVSTKKGGFPDSCFAMSNYFMDKLNVVEATRASRKDFQGIFLQFEERPNPPLHRHYDGHSSWLLSSRWLPQTLLPF